VRPVARFSETPNSIRLAPPILGQHTEEILSRSGISVPKSPPKPSAIDAGGKRDCSST
jgi:crotonobetainyl-CoA:carnitine CoA-transferase CaiB-like acyl-CoA transferase